MKRRTARGDPFGPRDLPHKHPVMPIDGLKVAGLHPSCAFGGMAALGPAPQGLKDRVVHGLEDLRADHMPVIQRPAPDERVQVTDERPSSSTLVGFDDARTFRKNALMLFIDGLMSSFPWYLRRF